MSQWVQCPTCHGTRIITRKVGKNKIEMTCTKCGGSGVVPK